MNSSEINFAKEKVNLETAQIPWKDLQRFFASGLAVFVSADLDLIEVAHEFAVDNKNQVEQWLRNNQVTLVPDQQALQWFESDTQVWAVVIKPWVLIQA